MAVPNQKMRSVPKHDFSMTPDPTVPRSQFDLSHGRKAPFNFSDLVPILVKPMLPGDTWNAKLTMAARTAVPLKPVQDNWRIEFFAFATPLRVTWDNSRKFWGEQDNPGDSTAYTMPKTTSPAGGWAVGSLQDHMGIPVAGQIAGGNTITVNVCPMRAYNRIYQDWFRDENLQAGVLIGTGDGPDAENSFIIRQRGKRFDQFTQALPWPQKGNTAVSLPLTGNATIRTQATPLVSGAQAGIQFKDALAGAAPAVNSLVMVTNAATGNPNFRVSTTAGVASAADFLYPANLYADLSTATAATINALRTSITLQQYLENDARYGTRYPEYVYGNFRVRTADARLNRPEFIGYGKGDILTTAVPQTSATGLTGGTSPLGDLAASGYGTAHGGFTYSATEHGYIIVLACATVDLTYSQGLDKMWSIDTRYDWPVPLLAGLGEQAMANREIYCDGSANDANTFGYVPRFDEWRYAKSEICGIMRPRAAGNIAYWNSSENFAALPTLNSAFITDQAKTVVQRNFQAGAATLGQQILADFYWDIKVARALPLYGQPGLRRL